MHTYRSRETGSGFVCRKPPDRAFRQKGITACGRCRVSAPRSEFPERTDFRFLYFGSRGATPKYKKQLDFVQRNPIDGGSKSDCLPFDRLRDMEEKIW